MMKFSEYRDALEVMELDHAKAAKLLGIDRRTSYRYASEEESPDHRPVPDIVARFLCLLQRAKITPDRALKLLEEE